MFTYLIRRVPGAVYARLAIQRPTRHAWGGLLVLTKDYEKADEEKKKKLTKDVGGRHPLKLPDAPGSKKLNEKPKPSSS